MKKPLRILLVFLATAVAFTLVTLSRPLLSGEKIEPDQVLATAAVGLLVAAGIFGVVRWQEARERKKPKGFPTVTRFRSAMSSGRVPADADRELWRRELDKTIRQERPFVWIGPLVSGAFVVLGIFLITTSPTHPWYWVIVTALFAGLAFWSPPWTFRRRRKMEALKSQLLTLAENDQPLL
ncbi:hypothetical protein ACRB8A_20015 (plasmid) [Arthrobacter sp. G.S.26]|uniref:hypothetical protein n=1 Tax=Arthrobacter sp. G.S.26 TaxID=3433706 RepID=UPI003D786246